MRQIVLDTETTGLEPEQGHRIIEIGCVELVNRRATGNDFHQYLKPDREIDPGAQAVHGISNEFLADKPRMEEIAQSFIDYIKDAELIIHNAPFDVGFINSELKRMGANWGCLDDICTITDTLAMAREMRPGQRNNLDALCKFYDIDNTHRELHGALLDARILSDVYLAMTGGQTHLALENETENQDTSTNQTTHQPVERNTPLRVIVATDEEISIHNEMLDKISKASGGKTLWLPENK